MPPLPSRVALNRRRCTAALLSTVLAGCQPPAAPLRVGSIVFPGYEHLFLARARGGVAAERLRLVELPASGQVLRALGAGLIEAAQLTLEEVLTARSAHLDLVVLAVLDISRGSDAVYSRLPLDLKDLAGRSIAVEEGAAGTLMLDGLLRAAGLLPRQLQRVPTTLSNSALRFLQGKVDLVITAEPWASEIAAAGGHRLFDSTALPDLIVDVFVARRDALDRHADALRQTLAQLFAARDFHRHEPVKAAVLMAPRLQVSPARTADAFKGLHLPDLTENRALLRPDGGLQRSAEALVTVMQRAGLLRSETPRRLLLDGFARADFLPEVTLTR